MSDPTQPWIHLPLDELFDDALWDISGHKRKAIVEGAASIVQDEMFGSCLSLAGGSVRLPKLDAAQAHDGLTIMGWLRPEAQGEGNLLTLASLGAHLLTHSVGHRPAYTPAPPGSTYLYLLPGQDQVILPSEVWSPFAVSWRRDEHTVCIQAIWGRSYEERTFKYARMGTMDELFEGAARPDGPDAGLLGYTPALPRPPEDGAYGNATRDEERARGFRGRLAQLRIYAGALDRARIQAIATSDAAPTPANGSHVAIGMSLENEDAAAALFIDALPGGHRLTLRVMNEGGAVTRLLSAGQTPSIEQWHFRVLFRPGTLKSVDTLKVATPGFSLAAERTSEGDVVWLLGTEADITLPLNIAIDGVQADARQGTRATRVELSCRRLALDGEDRTLGDRSTQPLNLINHRGRAEVPVHVGFTGSNRIVIGGHADLRLHVTNILPTTVRPGHSNILDFSDDSCLKLSFDDRPGTDWALASAAAIQRVKVALKDKDGARRIVQPDPTLTSWTVPLRGRTLHPVERLELFLTAVPAEGSEGHSNLYVELVDIPGYWNARVACPIEKVSPPVAPRPHAPEWKRIALEPGWVGDPGSEPEYYVDSAGTVHLRGQCRLSGIGKVEHLAREFVGMQLAFRLPREAAPAKQQRLYGNTHLLRPGHPVASCFELISPDETSCTFLADVWTRNDPLYGVPRPGVDVDARLYLDGISYPAAAVP